MPPFNRRLKELLTEVAAEHTKSLQALEIMPDHLHLCVEAGPTLRVAEIVNRFKGFSSRVLRSEFAHLRWRLPTLWSRSYLAAKAVQVWRATIKRYIEAQKGR